MARVRFAAAADRARFIRDGREDAPPFHIKRDKTSVPE
jgi:hypothetical protein